NALTRTTAILAAAFFATSLTLSILARYGESPIDILDRLPVQTDGSGGGQGGVLDQLGGAPTQPAPPSSEAEPATPPSGEAQPATPPAQPSAPSAPAVPNQ